VIEICEPFYKPFSPIRFFILIIGLIIGNASFAQRPIFTNQQHFGIEDGLPQSFITGFAQDKDGFIWISTLDGLSRYDGRGFKNFRYKPGDSTSLAQNAVFKMFPQAGNDKLTLIYEGLLYDRFDTRTFKSNRISQLATLQIIPKGKTQFVNSANVYNGTDWLFLRTNATGIGWRNSETGKTYIANKANGLLKQDTISTVFQTADGTVFLVSEDGVQVSDKTKSHFKFIRFKTLVPKLTPEMFRAARLNTGSVALLPHNRLLICRRQQIVMLDLAKKTSKIIPIPAGPPVPYQSYEDLLCQDSKGLAYFVNNGRVFRVNQGDQLELLWQNTTTPQFNITAFFVDRSDVLWLSVNAQGITKIDLRAMPFHSHPYKKSFVTDILEEAGVSPTLIPAAWADPRSSYYFRQARDSKNRLYICTNPYGVDEIFMYDGKIFEKFAHLLSGKIYSALVVKPNDEISIFDTVNSRWYNWKTPDSVPDSVSLDRSQLPNVEMADGYYHAGSMWLSTYSTGLLHYRGDKRIAQFMGKQPGSGGYMPKELTEICPDPADKNQLWIGSRGSGLILWDVKKGLQKIYTTDDGLPNNTIYCILPDKTGKLWCSTNKGIFRFDPKAKTIHTFEKSDGLQGNEFNRAHKFSFFDGRLAFGGTEGYTILDPADFGGKNPETFVPIQMTSLQINNQIQIPSEPGSIIQDPLSLLKQIDLPYDRNHLRFEFAAMLYNQPAKTKYRFQMEGIDQKWVENGTSNVASYVALEPGTYKLLVNATDNRGLWSNHVKEIAIVIHPPFWATIWAYLFYTLIVMLVVRGYFIFREERIQTRQNLAFEKREALRLKEMDELKDRFFSNVTHEFRTPLTLIISPLDKILSDGSVSGTLQQTLQSIQKNSRQLLSLINEFLDFSKLNEGQMQMNVSSGDLAMFVSGCVQSFESAALDKNVGLSFSAEEVEGFYLFDHEKWNKIVVNLVGNALKFIPERGGISVLLKKGTVGNVVLEVLDNGPGIPIDQQQKVFERFYQADGSAVRKQGGTGIGLSLVKEIAEFMGGRVMLDSEPGKYSRFTVEVPIERIVHTENISKEAKSFTTGSRLEKPKQGNDQPQVLVVEDNEELLQFVMKSLEGECKVTGAVNGISAWEMIRTELPDIVVSDVMMPGRDGFDLCNICKSDPLTAHIGFILLTSKAAHEARLKGLQAGADDYITKPFQMDELELRVLNLSRLQQSVREQLRAQLISNSPETEPKITDSFLVSLYREIDSKLDDPDLAVDDLGKALSVSKSTLNRKLKSLLDTSANDLIRQYRLGKATSLITSGVDIASASYKVGFSSPSYFAQCFREQYGITPSEYVSRHS
jgi:signal transduction histidine kinase/DNA-binding response OmpR family regulator